MTIRATVRTSPMLLALALLTSCTRNPSGPASQGTEPPAPSSASSTQASSPSPSSTSPSSPNSLSPTPSPSEARPGYVFPVRSKSVRFGRAHHDYPATDIFATCGSPVLAVTTGKVAEVSRTDTWALRENSGATRGGLSVSIVGTDGVRYYGSHLRSLVDGIGPGRQVKMGELLGWVGHTGSARATPCHLHFGISPPCATGDWWNRRGVLSPYPFLTSWQGGGQRSPVQAVADWRADHGCPKKAPK